MDEATRNRAIAINVGEAPSLIATWTTTNELPQMRIVSARIKYSFVFSFTTHRPLSRSWGLRSRSQSTIWCKRRIPDLNQLPATHRTQAYPPSLAAQWNRSCNRRPQRMPSSCALHRNQVLFSFQRLVAPRCQNLHMLRTRFLSGIRCHR